MEDNTGFMQGDSLGLSQGQGRGLAQVFDSTYNPVFKEEAIRNVNEDKKAKKDSFEAINKLVGEQVWEPQQEQLRQMTNDTYQYVMNNYRSIAKGNTPEAFEYAKKINEITNYAYAAKANEKFLAENIKRLDADKEGLYYDFELSQENFKKFLENPNVNAESLLVQRLDRSKYENNTLAPLIKKIVTDPKFDTGQKDSFGNIIYRYDEKTVIPEVKDKAAQLYESDKRLQKEYKTLENFQNAALGFVTNKAKQEVKQPYVSQDQKNAQKVDEFQIVRNEKEIIPFMQVVGEGKEGGKKGFTESTVPLVKVVSANFKNSIDLNPLNLKSARAVPMTVKDTRYLAKKTGDNQYNISSGFKDNFWDSLDAGSATFTPSRIGSAPFLKPKMVNGKPNYMLKVDGGDKEVDIRNISLSEDDIEKGEFRGVKLSDDNVEYGKVVIGKYDKKVGEQSNFEIQIPLEEYKKISLGNTAASKEWKLFEEKVLQEDPDGLRKLSYSEAKGGKSEKPQEFIGVYKDASGKERKIKVTSDKKWNQAQLDEFAEYVVKHNEKNPNKPALKISEYFQDLK